MKSKSVIFVESFKRWQKLFGLTDWKLVSAKHNPKLTGYAAIKYYTEGRHFYLYHNMQGCASPEDVGLHEALHLLLADAAIRSNKEEHKIVYRLENLLGGKKEYGDRK